MTYGAIGAVHRLFGKLGLPQAIDERIKLLKVHLPYHESDHVLTVAYSALCGGSERSTSSLPPKFGSLDSGTRGCYSGMPKWQVPPCGRAVQSVAAHWCDPLRILFHRFP